MICAKIAGIGKAKIQTGIYLDIHGNNTGIKFENISKIKLFTLKTRQKSSFATFALFYTYLYR